MTDPEALRLLREIAHNTRRMADALDRGGPRYRDPLLERTPEQIAELVALAHGVAHQPAEAGQ
ncbi:hypothetical protein ACXYTP_17745 [Tsukamurella ocularis]